jgi:hypothetical protein
MLALGLAVSALTALSQNEVDTQANVILPDGRRNLVVSNHTGKTVTAFAYTTTSRDRSGRELPAVDFFHDSAIAGGQKTVPPGAQMAFPAGPASAGGVIPVVKVEFHAAVFDDGSAFGDPLWVARIRDRRVMAIQALDDQLAILADAATKVAAGQITQEALADEIRGRMADRAKGVSDRDTSSLLGAMYGLSLNSFKNFGGKPSGDSIKGLTTVIRNLRAQIAKAAGLNPGGR